MIEKNKWLILETEQDFLAKWDESWRRWDHALMKPPKHFPCAFQYQASFDPNCGSSWEAISLELAKNNIKKRLKEDIALSERMLNKLYDLKEAQEDT